MCEDTELHAFIEHKTQFAGTTKRVIIEVGLLLWIPD